MSTATACRRIAQPTPAWPSKLATGISVTHPEGTSGPRPGQRVVIDGGANLMVATYREAAEGGWPVVEDPGSFFPLGPMSQVQHRVAGGVDVDMDAAFRFGREGPAVGLVGSSPFCSLSASIKTKLFFL